MAHPREDGSLPFVSTVQSFGKSGWSSRALRAYTQKNHPVQIVRKMPLAYDNQRAPKSDSAIFPVSEIFGKTIFPALVRAIAVGIRRSVRYLSVSFF